MQHVVEECLKLSETGKISFPEVVARFQKAGIETYIANFLSGNITYIHENTSFNLPLQIQFDKTVASSFDEAHLIKTLRAVQSKQIDYLEFVKQSMKAGVVFYIVFINGGKVIYYGRNGEHYQENFK